MTGPTTPARRSTRTAGRTPWLLYIEIALIVVFAVATVLLLWRPDWIEGFGWGFDPDEGSGSLERLLAVVPAVAAVSLSIVARREALRLSAAGTASALPPNR